MSEGRGYPLLMLVAACIAAWRQRPEVVGCVSVLVLAVQTARQGVAAVGLANALTWFRILATAGLPALPAGGLWLPLAALAIFVLDGVDGAIARSRGTESTFGAELDKECDAFFVLTVGLVLWCHDVAGAWVLIGGLWRYVYALIVSTVAQLQPAPRSAWGRYSYSASCVCFILALWSQTPGAEHLAAIGTVLVSASFLRSLYYGLPRI